ncbi:MAG: acetylglutamate kinase [Planctomycetes bacterium]|nr:acetylglutamate kinase [Planctomycetota bacterium]MCB9903652.1 acetylglutamate kinase [Planctomycetota bacterium]
MRLMVKVGGAQLETPDGRKSFAASVAAARAAGHEVIVVHGGGAQLKELSERVGLQEVRHEGLRVTCAETSELALCVLGGSVNKTLVRALEDGGVPSIGLTGADGSVFRVRKHAPKGVDLGYVGEVEVVDPKLVDALLAAGFMPVLSSVAPLAAGQAGDASRFYNVNADSAAGALAAALAVDVLLFLTDVPAVRDGAGRSLALVDPANAQDLIASGALQGGMLPKVRAALDAIESRPSCIVKIAPAAGTNAVLEALDKTVGTSIAAAVQELC